MECVMDDPTQMTFSKLSTSVGSWGLNCNVSLKRYTVHTIYEYTNEF